MDSQRYLESYGWTPGQPLQKGGIKKPILVSHKFDLKGVGHTSKDSVSWWETMFDGHLKSLDVNRKNGFGTDAEKLQKLEREEKKKTSPLYQMFVKGEVLVGTADRAAADAEKKRKTGSVAVGQSTQQGQDEDQDQLMFFFSSDDESENESESERKRRKRAKKDRKEEKKERRQAKREKKAKRARKQAKRAQRTAKHESKRARRARTPPPA